MKMLNKVFIIAIAFQISCNGKSNVDQKYRSLIEANRLLEEYKVSRDTTNLAEAYKYLKSNEQFVEEGLTKENYDLVMSLLMYLRKYDELENLIVHSNYPIREREMTLSLIKSLEVYGTDSLTALKYIDNSISLINNKIKENPEDSLIYVDYFIIRLYKNGREKTLLELDSFKLVDKKFSDIFYESVLRDVIEEYPDEYLFSKD